MSQMQSAHACLQALQALRSHVLLGLVCRVLASMQATRSGTRCQCPNAANTSCRPLDLLLPGAPFWSSDDFYAGYKYYNSEHTAQEVTAATAKHHSKKMAGWAYIKKSLLEDSAYPLLKYSHDLERVLDCDTAWTNISEMLQGNPDVCLEEIIRDYQDVVDNEALYILRFGAGEYIEQP